jgi:hypothetical protein
LPHSPRQHRGPAGCPSCSTFTFTLPEKPLSH